MNSSDADHKNLSATIGTTSDAPNDDDRPTRDHAGTHSGAVSGSLAHPVDVGQALLAELAVCVTTYLAAITDTCARASASDDLAAHAADNTETETETETAAAHESFIGRSQPTPEYGNRLGVETTYYGTTDDDQPLVSSSAAEQRARANANDRPHDTLRAATDADALSYEPAVNTDLMYNDTRGERFVGIASGLDERAGRAGLADDVDPAEVVDADVTPRAAAEAPAETATGADPTSDAAPDAPDEDEDEDYRPPITDLPVELPNGTTLPVGSLVTDLRGLVDARAVPGAAPPAAHAHDGAAPTADECGGLATLDVRLPDGQYRPLDEVVDDLDPFTGTTIEGIEMSLAQQAEIQAVTDGILRDYEVAQAAAATGESRGDGEPEVDTHADAGDDDGPFLVGTANRLNRLYDDLADQRPTPEEVAEARERRVRERRKERVKPLATLDEATQQEVCTQARRLLSDEYTQAVEIRKTPLSMALALASNVQRGMSPVNAMLQQADVEATNPRNVLHPGNVRYASTKRTSGRIAVEGEITKVFETPRDGAIQDGFISGDDGAVLFVIWEKSAWDELASTADPTDAGQTVVKHRRFPELREGDRVRFDNVFKGWYNGDPALETRRDSEIRVIERAPETRPDVDASGTDTDEDETAFDPETAVDPVTDYDVGVVPKQQSAYERGADRWVYPDASWIPDWWKAQDNVQPVGPADPETTDEDGNAGAGETEGDGAVDTEAETGADTESGSTSNLEQRPPTVRPSQSADDSVGHRPSVDPEPSGTGSTPDRPVANGGVDRADADEQKAAERAAVVDQSKEPDPKPCPTCGREMTFDIISEHGTRRATTLYEGWWCSACEQGHQQCPICGELHHPDHECAPKHADRLQEARRRYGGRADVHGDRFEVPDHAIEANGNWATIRLVGSCPACGSDLNVDLHRREDYAEYAVPEWGPAAEWCTQFDNGCDHRC